MLCYICISNPSHRWRHIFHACSICTHIHVANHRQEASCVQVLGELVLATAANEAQMNMMDANLTKLVESIGACETLLKTPIPLSYTRHTSRLLVIWVSSLPIILWDQCRYATVPVAGVISFLLLGIEEIGVQIEEPFSILPLGRIPSHTGAYQDHGDDCTHPGDSLQVRCIQQRLCGT